MMDPQIEFQGIDNPDLRRQINELMEDLFQFLPSDSAIRASFRCIHDEFLAEVRVASTSAYMAAKDQAHALNDLLDHIKLNVMGQIIAWRNHRFAC